LKAWLRKQQSEVAIAFAARAALRVLPIVQRAQKGLRGKHEFLADIVLPVFRATGAAWAVAKYPAQATEFSAAARAAGIAARATRDAAFAAQATADAAIAARAAANAALAARPTADATVFAAQATADAVPAAPTTLWSAVSFDAMFVEEGATASVIAETLLWPQIESDQLQSLWQELKAALHAAGQDWQVWTTWYEDRLQGRVRDEARELAHVRIEAALWDQGPAAVNAEIKRRIEAFEPRPFISAPFDPPKPSRQFIPEVLVNPVIQPADEHELPLPIENVPSAVSFGWTSKGTITIVAGAQNWPVFPFQGGQQDHANRLEACRVLATDAARSLRSGEWNIRPDYAEILDQYVAHLPNQPEEGNFLLADAKARIIRAMFAAEQDFLPVPVAAELKVFLEQHIGLRGYYPATEDFYESVRSGHLERPLPMDAVAGLIRGVRDNTPTKFEPNVADTLEGVVQPLPQISMVDAGFRGNNPPLPVPPPDPLGEIDPEQSRRFTFGSAANAFWKAVLSGDKAAKTVKGWSEVNATLGPKVVPILEWLRTVL
jgi:hypothetical protein